MMMRQIILDTETTGINVEEGHRIIEIGCIEMINRKLTGKHFHCYLNPGREIDAGAVAVHGLTNDFLKDKPTFSLIADELLAFIVEAELIIHNAPFDLSFLNYEFALIQRNDKSLEAYCRIIDTLPLARKLHAGQRNNLDALCKRYGIDNSKREYHGALLDAHLLAQVYLAMTGGQGSFFDSMSEGERLTEIQKMTNISNLIENHVYQFLVLKANEQELMEHKKYLENLKKTGRCLWLDD